MAGRDIVVIGASAGGIEALCQLVAGLPPGLPAALFVVCHFPSGSFSVLPRVLSRSGPLLARHARDGEPIYPAHIYVAPPDYHLTLAADAVEVRRGPRENRFRPAIDPLFRSAARVFGTRTLAVLLSGSLNDGVAGLLAVRSSGGLAVVQDPADAVVAELPRSALGVAGADYVSSASELGPLLARLVADVAPGGAAMNDPVERIAETIEKDMADQQRGQKRGGISVLTCPECGGALWQLGEDQIVRFRCHVGHAYAAEALLADKSAALEAALWTAVRTFREKGVLARQLAEQSRKAGNDEAAERFEEDAELSDRQGELIREALAQSGGGGMAGLAPATGGGGPG